MKGKKDYIIVGLALFSMFFGAGNLIFPPALGLMAGDKWFFCMLGFFLTGIGMPVLGIVAVAKSGGTVEALGNKVNNIFSKVLAVTIILAIGPLIAIPRTGATVYELGVRPLFSNASPLLVSIVYFSITLFFVINQSGIIDKIGKILTPILLTLIGLIVIKGILIPIGLPINTGVDKVFLAGFQEGYQTMDALASIIFGGIILYSLDEKGYSSLNEKINITIKAGIIAGVGLVFVYGGLLYLGATASGIYSQGLERTSLIVNISESILGGTGKILLSMVVSVACLTTSIGLTATVGNYFEKLSKGRLSYRFLVVITLVFSTIVSVNGVDNIVRFAGPLLSLVYPSVIVLIIMALFDNYINNKNTYKGAVYTTFIISFLDLVFDLGALPLSDIGFPWLLPAILGALLGGLYNKNK